MSFNPYQQLTPEQVQEVKRIASGEITNKRMTTVWYNPEEECYYKANNPESQTPDYGVRITKAHAFPNAFSKLVGGSAKDLSATQKDELRFNPFTDEMQEQAIGLYSRMDKLRKEYAKTRDPALVGAGTVTQADYSALTNVMADATIKELIARDFVLMQAVTVKPWSKLVYTHHTSTPFRNTYGLGELDISDSASPSFTRASITLKKAQGRVSISIWADMTVRDIDVTGETERMVNADFERGYAQEIATLLATGTDAAAAGAFDVVAAGDFHHTTNPATILRSTTATVRTNGGMADTLAMNSITYGTLVQNTWMRTGGSVLAQGPSFDKTSARVTTHPLLPGFTIYIDELLPNGSIFIYDKSAVIFLEGPTSTRTVESDFGTIRDTVSDRWIGSGIKVAGQLREITATVT